MSSTARISPTAGRVSYALLPKGPNGRALCRFCKRECPRPRMTFCGAVCVHEHKLRSDPAYARAAVFARDKGVCAVCRTDTEAVRLELLAMPAKRRRAMATKLGYPYHRLRSSLWDCDHVRPVALGGGESGLNNLQTLCPRCHHRKTAVQTTTRNRTP